MLGHIEACNSSGLTVKAYCLREGIAPGNYYYWLKKLQRQKSASFTQVPITSFGGGTIKISYPNGVIVELPQTHPSVIKELICCI